MKIRSIVLSVTLCSAFLIGCSTQPAGRLVYRESQFASRLDYLRYCQEHELFTGRCE
ncbi:MAG: hypothetical protein OEN50_12070 [Deltaproteobacteria bacterium]|nr:hypothetical protein [Deltaproteobacteria bacterium]